MKPFFLGCRWINNHRKSKSVWYNTPHWKIIALICCSRRSSKVTLTTVFVSIVAWKQAWWPPLFITFLISPCLVTSTYQVSLEIYGGFLLLGSHRKCPAKEHNTNPLPGLKPGLEPGPIDPKPSALATRLLSLHLHHKGTTSILKLEASIKVILQQEVTYILLLVCILVKHVQYKFTLYLN